MILAQPWLSLLLAGLVSASACGAQEKLSSPPKEERTAGLADWPQWRGSNRDGKIPGFQPPNPWPKELQRVWQVEVGEGRSTPVLVDGRLYVHARADRDEIVLAVDPETGKEFWRTQYFAPDKPGCSGCLGWGPVSSPAVAGSRVFSLGQSGILSCLDAATGRVLWRHDYGGDFPGDTLHHGTSMSPLLVDDLLIVQVGGSRRGAILALDAASGKARWKWEGDGSANASPRVETINGRREVVTLTSSHAVGLDLSDGRLLWQLDCTSPYGQNYVAPVVCGDVVILSSGTDRGLSAYRLGGEKSEKIWHTEEVFLYKSIPILKGDRLFGFCDKKKGRFFCLDVSSGKILWIGEPKQGPHATLLHGGNVLIALVTGGLPNPGAEGGSSLVVFDASDQSYVERARLKVSDKSVWAEPLGSGRAVYIREGEKLIRWMIP